MHDELIQHALDDNPNEACGLIAGRGNEAVRSYRAINREASPVRYDIEPADLLRLFRQMDQDGLEHIGIYHSHTHTQAYPSATDIRLAFYPEAFYVLVSLMDNNPHVRAFRIIDGKVSEATLTLTD